MRTKSRFLVLVFLLLLAGLWRLSRVAPTVPAGAEAVSPAAAVSESITPHPAEKGVPGSAAATAVTAWAEFAARDEREHRPLVLRPIEAYPILTAADRVDLAGQPVEPLLRGMHSRRILDEPVVQEIARENPEPLRPFGAPQAARQNSPFAHDHYARSAVEVGLYHRLFHEAASGSFSRLRIPVTETREVTLKLDQILLRGPQTFSFLGTVEEHPDSMVILVYNEGTVSGGVSLHGTDAWDSLHYEFMAMEAGLVAVRELDPLAFLPQECGTCGMVHGEEVLHDPLDPLHDGNAWAADEPMGDGVANVVDVVVGYGRQARVADGGTAAIEGRIIASVDRMNLSFANSQVTNTRLVLLGMIEDPDYEFPGWESGTQQDELQALNNPNNGRLDVVGQLRIALGADLKAFIIRDTDGSAGLAYRPGAASITARTYMTNNRLTFVHELGHNFGLRHSWGDTASDSVKTVHEYGWRFRSGNTRRRTVMAYDWGWERTPYFGNPHVLHPSLNVRVGAVNGYDATGDATTDSRYVSGGMVGGQGSGFDGTNSSLGARAAHFLTNNAQTRANLRARAPLTVTSPASGSAVEIGLPTFIEWVGGVYNDSATVELLKGGEVLQVLATGAGNNARVLPWVPEGLSRGDDYQIRIRLQNAEETYTSGAFSIDPLYPRVIDTFVSPLDIAAPGLEQVSLTFNRAMDPSSFSLTQSLPRFTGPDGGDVSAALSHVSWSEGNTVLTVHFAPLTGVGTYRLDVGPALADTRGYLMDQNDNAVPGEAQDGFGFSFRVADTQPGGTLPILTQNFDAAHSFTLDAGWSVGVPNGSGGPGAAFSPPNVLASYLNTNYASGVNISATSPSFSTYNADNIRISFRRWLGLAALSTGPQRDRFQDSAFLEYSINQGTWQTLWSHISGPLSSSSWQLMDYTLPASAENQMDVRIRFRLQTQSADSYGWNIDDLLITGDFATTFGPPPPPRVVGHFPAGAVIVSPTSIWLDFDQPMDTSSFSLGDIVSFSGPGGSVTATGFAWEADNRLRIDFPAVSVDGLYTLTLGTGVQNVEGAELVTAYAASFDLGTFDPPVLLTESLPAADTGVAYSAPVAALSDAGLPLTLAVSGRPAWLAFTDHGNGSGTLSGTPPVGSDGTLTLTFSAFDGASTTQAPLELLIRPRARIALAAEAVQVMENAGSVTIQVTRSLNATGPVSVQVFTADGDLDIGLNAVAGTDYQAASGTLHWADGELGSRSFTVQLLDDDLSQGDRPFSVVLQGVTGIATLGLSFMEVLIVDDDVEVAPRIVLRDQGTVTHMRATLNAFLEAGSPDTTATLWWGTADGGDAPGDWTQQENLGGVGFGPFSATLEGLAPETTYFYRFQAVNVHGQHQTLTDSFTTRAEPDGQTFAITFPGYDRGETLLDFPVLIRLSEANVPEFSYANMLFPETGGDLRFYDAADHELPFSVQLWNPEGESLIWVRVPALHADAVVTMVIGDAFTEELPAYTTDGSAWNGNFRAVYHFQGSGTSVPDATAFGVHGTVQNPSATTFVPGVVGSGYDFSGAGGEHISTGVFAAALNIDGAKPRTTSVWAFTRSYNSGALYQVGRESTAEMWSLRTTGNANEWRMQFWGGDRDFTTPTQNEWVYLTMVYDGTQARVYRNGVLLADSVFNRTLNTSPGTTPLQVGLYRSGTVFNGILDEFRISDVARSENWIWAEWKNMAQTDQFLAFEPLGGGAAHPPAVPVDLTAAGVSSSQIDLSWSDPSDPEDTENPTSPAAQFRIERSADGVSGWTELATVMSTTYSDTGLQPESTWSYRVSGINSAGTSPASSVVSATTLPPPPPPAGELLLAEYFEYGPASLDNGWSAAWSDSTNVVQYHATLNAAFSHPAYSEGGNEPGSLEVRSNSALRGVQRQITSDNPTGTFWVSALMRKASAGADTPTFIVLNDNDSYSHGSTHADGFGLSGNGTAVVPVFRAQDGTLQHGSKALSANTFHLLLAKVTIGEGEDTLHLWVKQAADVFEATEASLGPPDLSVTTANFGSALRNIWVGQQNSGGTDYVDAIRISSVGGNDGLALVLGQDAVPPSPPPAPGNPVAEAMSSSRIELTWSDPADPSDTFRVERSSDGQAWNAVATVFIPAYSDTDLAVHTWYSYRVTALRGGLESAPSAVVTARTWTVYEFPDDDGDGVNDTWIATYFPEADADASVNRGNTTMTVRDIFIAGLDPEDEDEVFEIGSFDPGNGQLQFEAKPGREYRVLGSQALGADADWQVLADWSASPVLNLNGVSRMFLKLQVRLAGP